MIHAPKRHNELSVSLIDKWPFIKLRRASNFFSCRRLSMETNRVKAVNAERSFPEDFVLITCGKWQNAIRSTTRQICCSGAHR